MAESLRILILEDNPADAEMVQFELQEAGIVFTPKVVMTEEDFVRAIQEFSPDLILSDYDLPKYSGALALAEANRRCPDTPFILVTGAVTEDRAIDMLTQGAKDYVLKNRLNQRLVPAVRRALAEAEEHRARQQAEAELRKAHGDLESLVGKRTSELQAVLDTAPVAIWIAHDPECKLITGNAYADEIIMKTSRLGNISRSAAPGEAAVFYRVFHNGVELKPEEMPAQVATATGKPVTDMEVELVFSNGRQVHLIESAVPLFDSVGRVRGAVITGSDVSQIKQSESAFRQSEERQRLVLQASSIGTFEVDLLTGEGRWNETEFELLGLKPGDVKASPDAFFRFVHPDDVERLRNEWEVATQTGKFDAEFRIVRADGRERWLAGKGSFIFDGHPDGHDTGTSGKPLRFMGVNFDITPRKRAEEELRESRKLLQEMEQLTGVGGWEYNAVTKHISWTDEIFRIHGVSPQTYNPNQLQQSLDFYPPHDRAIITEAFERAVNNAEPYDLELSFVKATGEQIWVRTIGQPDVQEGRVVRVLGMVMDITGRKQAEEAIKKRTQQLEDANEELESFSYSVSHDLRAPLRAIDGYSRMLVKKSGNSLDEDASRMVNVIRNNAERMGLLIDDLLSFSRVLKSDIAISEINMDKLVKEVWADMRALNTERELEFHNTSILPGKGDPILIRQVLVNLISNAVKFTKTRKPGVVEVNCYSKNGDVVYCIKDNGVGFDMAFHDKLFGVFQRLHSQQEYEGTGVGLAIVHRIISRHGGRVWAEGEVDKGATFYFTLPISQE